jgi:hypothetical protein
LHTQPFFRLRKQAAATVQDAALLDARARRKLESIAIEILADGWKWTECRFPLRFDPGFPSRTDPA